MNDAKDRNWPEPGGDKSSGADPEAVLEGPNDKLPSDNKDITVVIQSGLLRLQISGAPADEPTRSERSVAATMLGIDFNQVRDQTGVAYTDRERYALAMATPLKLTPDPKDGTREGWTWCRSCAGIMPPGHTCYPRKERPENKPAE